MQPIKVSADAPGDIVDCSPPFNISNSDGFWSADPFLLADPAGKVHLFWAERITGSPGSGQPDAVMHAVWDGENWSDPIDIHLSPPEFFNRQISGIRGVIDDQGIIHLIWMGPDNTFFYSSAHANEAGSAAGWQEPLTLANDQTGIQYSAAIAYEPPQTLHILYGKSPEGQARSVSHIRSENRGVSWTEPADVYVFADPERGASNIRLIYHSPNKLYATWTEWDLSGNGQVIHFARSLDSGNTWDYPVALAERTGDEYERDWTNIAVLGEDQLVVMWEGGFRAYPQGQYSDDGGITWSEPIDIFYWLIADNGFANLIRDSNDRLHTFLVRRVREGHSDRCRFPGCEEAEANRDTNTLWHSVWEGGRRWREPQPVGNFVFDIGDDDALGQVGGNFTSVAINGGNQLVTAWFDYTYFELVTMICQIEDAPIITPQPWPTAISQPTATPRPTPAALSVSSVGPSQIITRTVPTNDLMMQLPSGSTSSPATPVFIAIIPVLVIIIGFAFYVQIKNRGH
jgi:hypothetical protein